MYTKNQVINILTERADEYAGLFEDEPNDMKKAHYKREFGLYVSLLGIVKGELAHLEPAQVVPDQVEALPEPQSLWKFKPCEHCTTKFAYYSDKKRFCSTRCRVAWNRANG